MQIGYTDILAINKNNQWTKTQNSYLKTLWQHSTAYKYLNVCIEEPNNLHNSKAKKKTNSECDNVLLLSYSKQVFIKHKHCSHKYGYILLTQYHHVHISFRSAYLY